MRDQAVIEIVGVSKRFHALRPLRIARLSLARGDCLALSGLDAEGLPGPAQVVTRLPVHIYALLFFVPMALLAALILGTHPSFGTAVVVIIVVGAIEATE